MTITLYGIPNCDSVKKARKWLDAQGVSYEFHDYKKHGAPEEKLRAWAAEAGWEVLCNRRGTTWRKLSDAEKDSVNDAAGAVALMAAQPSLIKRPVIEGAAELLVGYDEAALARNFL